jgi:hypothetical protein
MREMLLKTLRGISPECVCKLNNSTERMSIVLREEAAQ